MRQQGDEYCSVQCERAGRRGPLTEINGNVAGDAGNAGNGRNAGTGGGTGNAGNAGNGRNGSN